MSRPLLVETPIIIKSYDIDYALIVHNMVYIRWLEDLRTLILERHYSLERMLADGLTPILTKTEIEYRLPLRFGDGVTGMMWVEELGRTRWSVEGEFIVAGRVHTQARQSGYFASLETLRPVRVPPALHEIWLAEKS